MIIFQEKYKFPAFILIIYAVQYVMVTLYYLRYGQILLLYHIPAIILGVLLFAFNAEISVTENSVLTYSFFYFFCEVYDLKKVESCKFNEITAMNDFMGWGIRYSRKYGWSYIFSSDSILTVYSKDIRKTFSVVNVSGLKTAFTKLGIYFE